MSTQELVEAKTIWTTARQQTGQDYFTDWYSWDSFSQRRNKRNKYSFQLLKSNLKVQSNRSSWTRKYSIKAVTLNEREKNTGYRRMPVKDKRYERIFKINITNMTWHTHRLFKPILQGKQSFCVARKTVRESLAGFNRLSVLLKIISMERRDNWTKKKKKKDKSNLLFQ